MEKFGLNVHTLIFNIEGASWVLGKQYFSLVITAVSKVGNSGYYVCYLLIVTNHYTINLSFYRTYGINFTIFHDFSLLFFSYTVVIQKTLIINLKSINNDIFKILRLKTNLGLFTTNQFTPFISCIGMPVLTGKFYSNFLVKN